MPARAAAAALLTVTALAAGCSGEDDSDATSTPTTVVSASTLPSDGASPSESGTVSPTASPTASPRAESSPSPAPTAPTAGDGGPTTTATPEPVTQPTQGERLWAVYLAAAPRTDEATLAAARDRATSLGYVPATGDVDCDQGALEALDLPEGGDYLAVSLLFATEEEARAFASLVDGEVAAVASVQVFCLD